MAVLKHAQAFVCLHMWAELKTKTAATLPHVLCISANDVHIHQKARSRQFSNRLRKCDGRHDRRLCKT